MKIMLYRLNRNKILFFELNTPTEKSKVKRGDIFLKLEECLDVDGLPMYKVLGSNNQIGYLVVSPSMWEEVLDNPNESSIVGS